MLRITLIIKLSGVTATHFLFFLWYYLGGRLQCTGYILSDGESEWDEASDLMNQTAPTYIERSLIELLLARIPGNLVTHLGRRRMESYMNDCVKQKTRTKGSFLSAPLERLKWNPRRLLIKTGTKWCGPGNVAEHYDDLGRAREADKCCREHDHSLKSIPARQTRFGIPNPQLFTMTNCADDRKFFNCLLRANTPTAIKVGRLYFDGLKISCFKLFDPEKCTDFCPQWGDIRKAACRRSKTDTSKAWMIIKPPSFMAALEKKRSGGLATLENV
ncbi:uncharacterized protein LOC142764777 isoform X2 [Rhipicephalus microplus]|uniref:uncharacterized protein LOC142764777 isoform X2 n=1 Tax=Rhipicephalus microplus TaxID=6941 RepID=UPI003F6B4E86